jgi:hypothetical protein
MDNGGSYTVGFAAPGDGNLDGMIDIQDVAALIASGKYDSGLPADWNEGDNNHDGVVDVTDLTELLGAGLYNAGSYLPAAQPAAVSAAAEVGTTTAMSPAEAAFSAMASESQGVVGTVRKKSVFSVI